MEVCMTCCYHRVSHRAIVDTASQGRILYEVEDGHPVAHGRVEVSAIGTEEQVALAVDGAKQV